MTMLDAELLARAEAVVRANGDANRRIALAESCTGGLVAAAITAVPGCSSVFTGGFVTYADEAKMDWLGVRTDILETFGAVSIATAWAMAQGALDKSGADVAVSISGVAGPGGGSAAKPVGTVVFGRALRDGGEPYADMKQFGDLGRDEVRRQAALCALELLLP